MNSVQRLMAALGLAVLIDASLLLAVEAGTAISLGEDPVVHQPAKTEDQGKPAGLSDDDVDNITRYIYDTLENRIRSPEVMLREFSRSPEDEQGASQREREAWEQLAEDLLQSIYRGDWGHLEALLNQHDQEYRLYESVISGLGYENHRLMPEEVLALAEMDPEPNDQRSRQIGRLLSKALATTGSSSHFIARLQTGIGSFGGPTDAGRERAASILLASGRIIDAGPFIPPLKPAQRAGRLEVIDLHSRFLLAQAQEDAELFEQSWDLHVDLVQRAAAVEGQHDLLQSAMRRCLYTLLPHVDAAVGNQWLMSQLSDDKQCSVLLGLMANSSTVDIKRSSLSSRVENLQRCKRVLDEIMPRLMADKERWQRPVEWLLNPWVVEAEHVENGGSGSKGSSDSFEMDPRRMAMIQSNPRYRQQYMEYRNSRSSSSRSRSKSVDPDVLLETAPKDGLLHAIDPDLAERVRLLSGATIISTGDLDRSLKLIAAIRQTQPKQAREWAHRVLDTWLQQTVNLEHQAQSQARGNSGPWRGGGHYGAVGIPLTRARQARNIAGLGDVLQRIAAINIDLNPQAIAEVFASCHSPAEVFRDQDIAAIFGARPSDGARLALAMTMRQRLAGLWRKRDVQHKQKTGRKDAEIVTELRRGYALVRSSINAIHKRDWQVATLDGQLAFDLAEFEYGQQAPFETYVALREHAFEALREGAKLSLAVAPHQRSASALAAWFDAALGTSDLSYLTRQHEADDNQIAHIRALMTQDGFTASDTFMALMSQAIQERLSDVPGQLKHRYLGAAVHILDGHASAGPLEEILQGYNELLEEIDLDLQVIGSSSIGQDVFEVELRLRHTATVERESGGFGRYLSNDVWVDNAQVNFKDDLEDHLNDVLSRRCEILDLRFHDPQSGSTADGQAGWRATPLARIMLRPIDAAVDRLDPLQLDLDFVDHNGTVILPVTSPVVLLDATATESRPHQDVEVEFIAEERDGAVQVEVTARATGLPPSVNELIRIQVPGFDLVEDAEQEASDSVTFVELSLNDAGSMAIIERRNRFVWQPIGHQSTFTFPVVYEKAAAVSYQKILDADLAESEATFVLQDQPTRWNFWLLAGAVLVVLAGGYFVIRRCFQSSAVVTVDEVALQPPPDTLSPLVAIRYLTRVSEQHGQALNTEQRALLRQDVQQLEAQFYAGDAPPDSAGLGELLATWHQRFRQQVS